jgi:hypothetical protein
MDLDRLYIHDLLDTATRGHLGEQQDIAPDDGAGLDEPIFTTQAVGEEGEDPEGDVPVDELPFTSGPADVENPIITTQAIGEEGDDPEGDVPVDELPFTSGPADVQNPIITTQAIGEEGDDPETDVSSDVPADVPFSAGLDYEDSGDDGFGDDDFSDDDVSEDDVFGAA